MSKPVLETHVPGYPCRRGKVRDVYDLGDRLVIVATDRISAFDWVLPTPIPDKGFLLTGLTCFWLDLLKVANHLLSLKPEEMGTAFRDRFDEIAGRSMLVKKTAVVPIECVVRGYLAGSGWKEYRQSGTVCGLALPAGLRESDRLPEPIFTPATKEESGHESTFRSNGCAIVGRHRRRTAPGAWTSCPSDGPRASRHHHRGLKFEWGRLPSSE